MFIISAVGCGLLPPTICTIDLIVNPAIVNSLTQVICGSAVIKENLIHNKLTKSQIYYTYASEADLLNVALFGCMAKEWRDNNQDKDGNVRDYATIEQLIVLVNLESLNAKLIEDGLSQEQRLIELNKVARTQLKSLLNNQSIKRLK